jgi:acyl-CoA thioesterase
MTHDFDKAIQLEALGGHRYGGATSPAYANMVGPFGGITSAVLLNATLLHPERQGDPIALTVNFAGPVADGPYEIEARPLRTNRSTQHWLLQMLQQGSVVASGTAVTALRRETWSMPEAAPPHDMPAPTSLPRTLHPALPAWTRRYDMRFVEGAPPQHFDGQLQPHSTSRLWVRDEPPRALDFASLASICDSFFPRIFTRRRRFAPIGTVTLSTFFHADAALLREQADRHVAGCARALNFRNGYFDQSAEIWSDGGLLLASTHQMVYFRE